jgi:hypothetical protein
VTSALGIPIRIDWVSVKDDLVSYHGVEGGGGRRVGGKALLLPGGQLLVVKSVG